MDNHFLLPKATRFLPSPSKTDKYGRLAESHLTKADKEIIVNECIENGIEDMQQYQTAFDLRIHFDHSDAMNEILEKVRKVQNMRAPKPEQPTPNSTAQPIPEKALKILKDPRLFVRITKDELDKMIVGELESRQTIFVCACGKWVLNNSTASYALLGNAEGGAGKDHVIKYTLEIFPKEDRLKRTRISPKALTYWHDSKSEPEWSWDGRILYLEDVSKDVLFSDVLKVFLSSGSEATITINQKAVDIHIEGKPVVFMTCASVAHLELEQGRRMPILSADETESQTQKILERQGAAAADGTSLEYDPDITEAMRHLRRVAVVVPFGKALASLIPPRHIIIRTGFPRFLDYIRAAAALHQFQRERNDKEQVVAVQQDYEIGAGAFKKTATNQFYLPMAHKQKKLYEILVVMGKEAAQTGTPQTILDVQGPDEGGFSAKEIETKVNFYEMSALYAELNKLADAGLLITGRRKVDGSKKDVKTFRAAELTTYTPPTWEDIIKRANAGIDGKTGIDGDRENDGKTGNNGINQDKSDEFHNSMNSGPISTNEIGKSPSSAGKEAQTGTTPAPGNSPVHAQSVQPSAGEVQTAEG